MVDLAEAQANYEARLQARVHKRCAINISMSEEAKHMKLLENIADEYMKTTRSEAKYRRWLYENRKA